MIIKRIAVGNDKEAYIENAIKSGINIISSDDNNKGKTVVIQSLIYCLGNIPVLPSSFDYSAYYHYVEFSHNGKIFSICRKGDTFTITNQDVLMFFDSISEMKRYWSNVIFPLPQIMKKDMLRIVDPELFVQIFFMGQDKNDTSNIANRGFYTKEDFINMLFSLSNLGTIGLSPAQIAITRRQIGNLNDEKKTLQKQHKILKSTNTTSTYLSQFSDKTVLVNKLKDIENIKNKLSTLRSTRNSAINRKLKYEVTLEELNSLNRTISSGELRCLECNSNHIGFATQVNKSYTFDISTPEIRQQIINSINEKISSYDEDVERYTLEINKCQEHLQKILSDEEVTLEAIVIHKKEILDTAGVETRLLEIDSEIKELSSALLSNTEKSAEQIRQQQLFFSSIIEEMNHAYKKIDRNGTLVFDNLFTKRDQVFSGSEATEFHLLKLYALAKILDHSYPIIVDSFRAEDLSTEREQAIVNLFHNLGVQVFFTTTLKTEEMGKYQQMSGINHIDYSSNAPSKILSTNYVDDFMSILSQLSISIRRVE